MAKRLPRFAVLLSGKEYGGNRQQRDLFTRQLTSLCPLFPKSCIAGIFNPKVLSECLNSYNVSYDVLEYCGNIIRML
jgi:hypothetical protein